MAQKKGSRVSSDDTDELSRMKLQAILLADSFTMKFRPITLERPKVLLPLVNVPMIEYSLAWLESVGVEEVFVFCCSHSQKVKDYLEKSQWSKAPNFSVMTIESHDSTSAGDALRTIYNQGVIHGDFVLVSGDTVSNACLKKALQEHKDRRKKDPNAVMTMLIKHSKPSSLTHQTRIGNEEVFMAIEPKTKQLLYYEDRANLSKGILSLDQSLLSGSPFNLHNDRQDCYIDICSQEVLSILIDNFDYQHLRRHFVKGLLVDDIMEYKIFAHEISSYAARVDTFRSYDTISKDIIQRWTYPFVPNVHFSENCPHSVLERQGIYKELDVKQSHTAKVGAFSVVGKDTSIGDNTKISSSVIGQGCIIGHNVLIKGCYIWGNVTIEDNCKLSYAIVCDEAHVREGAVLEPGIILSYKVVIGKQLVVPAYSIVSLCPQPSQLDSDEELEYADANAVVVESPSITSILDAAKTEFEPDDSEASNSGHGYIWSHIDGGVREEFWRHSVAPLPAEKLEELSCIIHAVESDLNQDFDSLTVSGELQHDSECVDRDDGDAEYNGDNDFEKEVEATFLRAVNEVPGVNQDHVILEVNSLKLSFNVSYADCAGALFLAVMKLALIVPHSTNKELLESTYRVISRWKDLLKHYVKTVDDEIEVILKFEEMCSESMKDFSPLFTSVLDRLYSEDIATEDAILTWASEKEGADESDKVFVKQSSTFIQWLKEAPEED